MIKYGQPPIEIEQDVFVDNSEMYFYQYLPIHLKGEKQFKVPERLNNLKGIIDTCCYNFANKIDDKLNDKLNDYYIYLTAKNLYVKCGENHNRMGWHCDGFMSDDINYIWFDSIPTEYVIGEYDLIQDHEKSIEQMNGLLLHAKPIECKPNSIYRLDEKVIHRCGYNKGRDAVLRHFVKVSFSKEKYNLKGNSHNYLLDYKWEMKD